MASCLVWGWLDSRASKAPFDGFGYLGASKSVSSEAVKRNSIQQWQMKVRIDILAIAMGMKDEQIFISQGSKRNHCHSIRQGM